MSNEISRASEGSGAIPIPVPVNSQQLPITQPQPVERYVFNPPIDIYEVSDGLMLRADLPGVTLDTLELQVQNNKLTLFGRVGLPVPTEAKLLHQEYHEGDFLRSFILSDTVDHERIIAKLNNGVLEVFLPHASKAQPRKIQVSGQ